MKIALVNPPRQYSFYLPKQYHLGGIGYIDAALRNKHDVEVIDLMYDPNPDLSPLETCDAVGITAYIDCYNFFKNFLPTLKGKKIIAGGPLISSYGRENNLLMRTFPEIDFGVTGEGEITITKLIEAIEKNKPLPKGVLYREGSEIKTTGREEIPKTLDSLSELNYSNWQTFSKKAKDRLISLGLTRGCYNQCSFCYKLMPGLRGFSLERTGHEIKKIAKLKPSIIHLSDEEFLYDKERAIRISEQIKKTGIPFDIQTRIDDADYKTIKTLVDNGCIRIRFGIESFSEEVLRKCNKNITKKQIYKGIEETKKAGLRPFSFLILGLPGETRQSIEEAIRGVKETGINTRPRLLMPLPGTQIYREVVQKGLINEEDLLKNYGTHYDTTFGNFVPINLTEIPDQELIEARDKLIEMGK
ncbi:B12-binding domain-containing radical SAM protein [Candidatus Woesearchaeota archaeon]|nr:B12-binding domain-containing radical SAM protein [Candidatus Woesearchaeota archaeon]